MKVGRCRIRHMQRRSGAAVRVSHSLARACNDDDHCIATGPAASVNNFLNDGFQVWCLLWRVSCVPGRNIVPVN